ncbi:MAG: circadian clock protein KaiA [Cyanobacterium sp. T60_A2020_053]|nr:circadian clock protein KaiA [Cyanobacterium sp. T60_A2020_053]
MSSRLHICIFAPVTSITQSITDILDEGRYQLHFIQSPTELNQFVSENKEKIDCLIILYNHISNTIIDNFYEQGLILPMVIIESPDYPIDTEESNLIIPLENSYKQIADKQSYPLLYHIGEVKIKPTQLNNITNHIDKAITQFLYLAPSCSINENPATQNHQSQVEEKQNFLLLQQRRLASKLKERLGYLGIYYNRKSDYFYRNLEEEEKQELIKQLSLDYREIILNYFQSENDVNQEIDQFVNQCFFADLSVSQILEIHMELMDEFAQQLKLEGRNEEILIDYRLVLIDIIAHVCEMYRRSIPRENLPF